MRNTLVLLAGLVVAGAAWANHCPIDMKEIDARLATKPNLSKADLDKVTQLRKSGEEKHKAGNHEASMKDLGEAKKLLGI